MKLLCILTGLCEGTPIQQLWLDFLESTFPLKSSLKVDIYQFFAVRTIEQGEMCAYPMRSFCSPILHPPQHGVPPPHLPHIPQQGKRQVCAATFCVIERRWRIFSLGYWKIFSLFTHLVLPLILTQPVLVIAPPWVCDMKNGITRRIRIWNHRRWWQDSWYTSVL